MIVALIFNLENENLPFQQPSTNHQTPNSHAQQPNTQHKKE